MDMSETLAAKIKESPCYGRWFNNKVSECKMCGVATFCKQSTEERMAKRAKPSTEEEKPKVIVKEEVKRESEVLKTTVVAGSFSEYLKKQGMDTYRKDPFVRAKVTTSTWFGWKERPEGTILYIDSPGEILQQKKIAFKQRKGYVVTDPLTVEIANDILKAFIRI
jgi:hypothetical protein